MAKLSIVKGSTSVMVRLFIQDSTSTTGAGKTGLTAASFTGTKVYVARDDDGNAGGTSVSLTDSTLGTWASGGIKEKDATNMPGVYEFGLTNASLVTGSRSCDYYFKGTGIAPLVLEIELTGIDNQNAINFGLSCLPTANPGAASGIFIAGSNAATSVNLTGNITGNLSGSVGSLTTNNDKTGYSLLLTQSVPTSNTNQTVGYALNAAIAETVGAWDYSTLGVGVVKNTDGSTLKNFVISYDTNGKPNKRS